jgi:hypothetical protein
MTELLAAVKRDDEWAVETRGLTKRFGDNIAVNDVELLVRHDCAFGYLGPNLLRHGDVGLGRRLSTNPASTVTRPAARI